MFFRDRLLERRFDLQPEFRAQPFREQPQAVSLARAAREHQVVPDVADILGVPG
jgi:hypothetical protein